MANPALPSHDATVIKTGSQNAGGEMLIEQAGTSTSANIHRRALGPSGDHLPRQFWALLDYCGLEFEPACLSFHETLRAVRTASSEQVRRPIYRDATEEWQRYEQHLGPLKDALGEVLTAYPEAPASFLQR